MANNVKQNIIVLAFPRDEFDRNYLNMKTDKELYLLARDNGFAIWPTILAFQYALNSDIVDTKNNWIYFIEKDK